MVLAGLICYLGFCLLPINGPIWALREEFASGRLPGYVITPLQDYVMMRFDPEGTCFPSSHVAIAWAAALSVRSSRRWILYAMTAGLTVSVVYTRYHYVSDAVLGLLVAVVACQVARRGSRTRRHPRPGALEMARHLTGSS
jgi:membrane-associated phospholipid phosphatase